MRPTRANLVSSLVPYVSHVMVCARLPGSTLSKKIVHASWDVLKVLIACGILIFAPPCSTIFVLSGLATTNALHPHTFSTIYPSKLPFASDRLCILVSGLLDAFVTTFNVRRTHRDLGLNFRDLMRGRIKMMTAQCRAWLHTYLSFSPDQLGPTAFWLPKPKKRCPCFLLSSHYQNDRD